MGGAGGNGGRAGDGSCSAENCWAEPAAGGGTGGSPGVPGNSGGILYIEAGSFINTATSIIRVNGQNGTNGNPGGYGSSSNCNGADSWCRNPEGAGGTYSGRTALGGYVGAIIVDCGEPRHSLYSGGGGAGGYGSGGGGGSAGLLLVKAATIRNDGNLQANGGTGGLGGAPGGNGNGGAIDTCGFSVASGGGGGGGGGGNGGHGADGLVLLIHNDSALVQGNIQLGSGRLDIIPEKSLPIIGDLNFQNLDSSDLAGHPYQFPANGWINFYGSNHIDIENTSYWFNINSIRIGSYDSNEYVAFFDIDKIFYNITTPEGTSGTTVGATQNFMEVSGKIMDAQSFTGNYYHWFNPTLSSIKNNTPFTIYGPVDGVNYVNVYACTRGGSCALKQFPLLIDQYAPCDDTINHGCTITLTDTAGNNIGLGSNTGLIKTRVSILEGAGSGMVSDGNESNLKYLMLKQFENAGGSVFEVAGNPGTLVDIANAASANKTCDELGGTGKPWGSNANFVDDSYNVAGGAMDIDFDLSGANYGEGTYWLFVCTKDRAGNWSLMADPSVGTLGARMTNVSPGRWTGASNHVYLSIFNAADKINHNYPQSDTARVAYVYAPTLRKRIFIDKPDTDFLTLPDGKPCNRDPCQPLVLKNAPGGGGLDPADKTASESDIRIAYSPVGFTNSSQIIAGIRIPPDKSGIKGLYYKIGNTPPGAPDDGVYVEYSQSQYDLCQQVIDANNLKDGGSRIFANDPNVDNYVDFCFSVSASVSSNLYVWLKDNAGNNSYLGYISRELFVDITPPTTAQNLNSTPNPTKSTTPTLTWEPSTDAHGIKEYYVCYWEAWAGMTYSELSALPKGQCPGTSDLLGKRAFKVGPLAPKYNPPATSVEYYDVPTVDNLINGRYDFSIVSVDTAGNISDYSQIYTIIISDGMSRLDFLAESAKVGGISPSSGSSGTYTFTVVFQNLSDLPPDVFQLWVDQNGDGQYSLSEQIDMSLDRAHPFNNGKYWDGEVYRVQTQLSYLSQTNGKVKYKFYFEANNSAAIDGPGEGDPTADNFITLDPYGQDSFNGMLQVRNNVYRPGNAKLPTILLKEPKGTSGRIKVVIYDINGRRIKTIYDGTYTPSQRYVIWDLSTDFGRKVRSGVYNVTYFYDGGKYEYKKVAVLR